MQKRSSSSGGMITTLPDPDTAHSLPYLTGQIPTELLYWIADYCMDEDIFYLRLTSKYLQKTLGAPYGQVRYSQLNIEVSRKRLSFLKYIAKTQSGCVKSLRIHTSCIGWMASTQDVHTETPETPNKGLQYLSLSPDIESLVQDDEFWSDFCPDSCQLSELQEFRIFQPGILKERCRTSVGERCETLTDDILKLDQLCGKIMEKLQALLEPLTPNLSVLHILSSSPARGEFYPSTPASENTVNLFLQQPPAFLTQLAITFRILPDSVTECAISFAKALNGMPRLSSLSLRGMPIGENCEYKHLRGFLAIMSTRLASWTANDVTLTDFLIQPGDLERLVESSTADKMCVSLHLPVFQDGEGFDNALDMLSDCTKLTSLEINGPQLFDPGHYPFLICGMFFSSYVISTSGDSYSMENVSYVRWAEENGDSLKQWCQKLQERAHHYMFDNHYFD